MTDIQKQVRTHLETLNTPLSLSLYAALRFIDECADRMDTSHGPSREDARSLRSILINTIDQSRLGLQHAGGLPPETPDDGRYESMVIEADARMKHTDGHHWQPGNNPKCMHCNLVKSEAIGTLCPRWFQTYLTCFKSVMKERGVTSLAPQPREASDPNGVTKGALAILLTNEPEALSKAVTVWHEVDARGHRADAIVWLRVPSQLERDNLEACLKSRSPKKGFDPDFAPPGYMALRSGNGGCSGCAFEYVRLTFACGEARPCRGKDRPDKKSVIFVRRPVDAEV